MIKQRGRAGGIICIVTSSTKRSLICVAEHSNQLPDEPPMIALQSALYFMWKPFKRAEPQPLSQTDVTALPHLRYFLIRGEGRV